MTNSINTHLGLKTYYTVGENILLPPKYEKNMVPSNHSFFQYCDSNIGLFSIAPCKVITLNHFCILLVSVLFYRKVGGAITTWGAIEKSQILLSQYWKKYHV